MLLVPCAGGVAPANAAGLEVQDIRIGIHEERTRFVIELSDTVEPRIFGLPDPHRIVIDLPEVNFTLPEARIGAGAGLIERLRYGLFRPGTSRFVLDLKSPAKVADRFLLKPAGGKPWRFVVDISATSREDFITAMRPEEAPPPAVATPEPPLRQDRDPGRRPVVVIDAGHGGVDPGAISPRGRYEKDIVLDYALSTRKALEEIGGFEVVLTRDRDIFLPLRERVRIARAAGADLFVSLHADSHPKSATRGFSIYTLSETASDKEAAALAARENKSDVIGGVNLGDYSDDVRNILIDFAQTKTNELSARFARDIVVPEMRGGTSLLSRPWRSAGFAVLKAPDVPSVLVELGFLSNPQEAELLIQPSQRAAIAKRLARAIARYFETAQNAAL